MILEAFSDVLKDQFEDMDSSAVEILHAWLLNVLAEPTPSTQVSKVIHTEIELFELAGHPVFIGKSSTGDTLLKTLYFYCESYERWQFGRWLHQIKPHQFNEVSS